MEKIASHSGIVTEVTQGLVKVHIEVLSACASCESHAHCGFAEKSDKIIDIETPQWQQFSPGDRVDVQIPQNMGLKAVWLAYVLPVIPMIALLVTLLYMGFNEGLTALLTLLLLAVYVLILYKFRHRLQQKFSFQIKKHE